MKLLIDSNRVIAALLKDSTTRGILFNKNLEFAAPEYLKTEIHNHKNILIERSGITEHDLNMLLTVILERIKIIPKEVYDGGISILKKGGLTDKDDAVYIAICDAVKAEGIWTHDKHFQEQNKIKIFTNMDLLKAINNL